MKKLTILIVCFMSYFMAFGANVAPEAYEIWHSSKYSMFIHFGLYSELGGVWQNQKVTRGYSEQIQSQAGIFSDSYAAVSNRFNPTKFNADEIVALAKAAGMRSIVITTKHHDGFCLWHTATTDFNAWDATPVPRDFIAELSEACKKGGLRFGLYFSLIDWHYPYAYPISSTNADPITPEHHQFSMQQITELLTGYGPISELWFDMGSLTPDQSKDLYNLVHKLQPDCMVSGRLGNDQYDFCVMGDNSYPDGTLKTAWQTPASMFNETWGYRSWQERGKMEDKAAEKLRSLLGVVSHGGNFLLNIGPKGDGSVVEFERDVLLTMGKWLDINGEAVYGTEAFEWPAIGKDVFTTKKGSNIYVVPSSVIADTVISVDLGGAKLLKAAYLDNGEKAKTSVKGGKCYLTLPATIKTEMPRAICLTFDKALPEPVTAVIKKDKPVLTAANAVADYSYSCFDYYTNYQSVVGYNWNITGTSGKTLELTYTAQYLDKDVTVVVDGETYNVSLKDGKASTLEDTEANWSKTYYTATRGSFSRAIPARVYEVEKKPAEVRQNASQQADPNLHPSMPNAGRPMQMNMNWNIASNPVLDKAASTTMVYIVRNVTVEQPCDQVVEFAAGNGVEVLVNGVSQMKHLNAYKEENRHELFKVHLEKGENQILVAAYNKWAKQIPLYLEPAENVVYTVTVPLKKALTRSATHTIHLGPAAGANPHTDIELSNIEITVR